MTRTQASFFLALAAALGAACHDAQPATTDGAAATGGASGADAPKDVSLPEQQRARIHSEVLAPTQYGAVIQVTGSVAFDGDQSTSVIAPISGPVTRLAVDLGATISRGQPLAYVSSPDFADAIADYRKAIAADRNASRVADLDEQLFKNDGIARRDLEQAQTDAIAARADLDAASQHLAALGVDPEDATRPGAQAVEGVIRSPISGTLVERLINPGELLSAGSTVCCTVADLSRVWVMASIFSNDLTRVAVGDRAEITLTGSSVTLPGRVDYIAALVDPTTKATLVRIVVPNPTHLLRRDMYVDVALHSQKRQEGLLVPVSAVLRDDDNQPFVFLDMGDGQYRRSDVELGTRLGDQYPVTAGLKAGDRVVGEGGLFLQFAQTQ